MTGPAIDIPRQPPEPDLEIRSGGAILIKIR